MHQSSISPRRPNIGLLVRDKYHLLAWHGLLLQYNKKVNTLVFHDLHAVLDCSEKLEGLIVIGWLGQFAGDVDTYLNGLSKVLYLQVSRHDTLPKRNQHVRVLRYGEVNPRNIDRELRAMRIIQDRKMV